MIRPSVIPYAFMIQFANRNNSIGSPVIHEPKNEYGGYIFHIAHTAHVKFNSLTTPHQASSWAQSFSSFIKSHLIYHLYGSMSHTVADLPEGFLSVPTPGYIIAPQ